MAVLGEQDRAVFVAAVVAFVAGPAVAGAIGAVAAWPPATFSTFLGTSISLFVDMRILQRATLIFVCYLAVSVPMSSSLRRREIDLFLACNKSSQAILEISFVSLEQ